MFSYFTDLIYGIFKPKINSEEIEENEDTILNKINCEDIKTESIIYDVQLNQEPLGKSKPPLLDVEVFNCEHKTGKVTYISTEYGIIDDLIYFEPSQVAVGLTLKKGDEVTYKTFKAKENETERILQIYELKKDSWNFNDTNDNKPEDEAVRNEEIVALSRVINGIVVKKNKRDLFIEPANIWFNLDKIEATYVPIEGDWVSLEAIVTINNESIDLTGEVLEIKSLKPLLAKTGIGRVTFWSDNKKEGAIENTIYFTNYFCEDGYVPSLGDEVSYEAIESFQDIYKWRALKVLPNETSCDQNKSKKLENAQFYDKNGISITPTSITIEIELHKTKTIFFEVTNNENFCQFLNKSKFNSRKDRSQLILKSPGLNDKFKLNPKETIKYVFECKARFLGLSREIFVFYFKNFIIAKSIEINVIGSAEMNKLLNCKIDTVFKVIQDKKFIKSNMNAETTLYGPKPWTQPKFMAGEKRGVYRVPDKLWDAYVGDSEFPKNKSESIKGLEKYASFLKEEINANHYVDRFHILLYLEEIELKKNFRKYDLNGVFLFRNGEYLVLEVPGLTEQRPSLILGDKIILTQPWSEANNVQQIGYIHEIHQKHIYVKFHGSFHESYDETECDVVFEPNLSTLVRSHDAVNRSMRNLGPKWLFPLSVSEKSTQVEFEIEKENQNQAENDSKFFTSVTNGHGDCIQTLNPKSLLPVDINEKNKKKKLKWYNKNLNERQRLAVVNVLEGRGRPLPYIIFGPPGTGKTVTLVEVAMQIYRLIPESRLLITSPSNSSADLICERLINLGKFKPGQLVRLLAFHRANEGNVPASLIPYCTVADLRDDSGRNLPLIKNTQNNIKSSTFSQLIGRHRITVGTCSCVGLLHYMGFPKGHFTHILVDEAGQATEPEVLISTTFQNINNGQVVLTGDPQQLGPVCISKIADEFGLGVSLLQRFVSLFPYARDFETFSETSGYDPRFITRLNINYRSVPEILSLPSQLFYNSELIPTVSQTEGIEADIIRKFNFEIENRKNPPAMIFHGIFGINYQESDSPSWFNPHEIWQAVSYLRKCYSVGLTSDDVGIVTPYLKQVQKLRNLLTSLELSVPKIGTIEEFQGQERHVIIISTVRSSFSYIGSDITHSLGFVASPRRLNVALTRARALVVILGNPVLLSKDPYWKNVVEYCVKNNSYVGCNLDEQCVNSEEEEE